MSFYVFEDGDLAGVINDFCKHSELDNKTKVAVIQLISELFESKFVEDVDLSDCCAELKMEGSNIEDILGTLNEANIPAVVVGGGVIDSLKTVPSKNCGCYPQSIVKSSFIDVRKAIDEAEFPIGIYLHYDENSDSIILLDLSMNTDYDIDKDDKRIAEIEAKLPHLEFFTYGDECFESLSPDDIIIGYLEIRAEPIKR
jgi:hypothetical protein